MFCEELFLILDDEPIEDSKLKNSVLKIFESVQKVNIFNLQYFNLIILWKKINNL